MKRGLKPRCAYTIPKLSSRWNTCPDEEGTETIKLQLARAHNQSWNTCPDEEGTETAKLHGYQPGAWSAGTRAPMKRGLKPEPEHSRSRYALRWNTCPDEEGTETDSPMRRLWGMDHAGTRAPMKRGLKQGRVGLRLQKVACWNTCPDEEGTETNLKYKLNSAPRHPGWNTCPDEEGTETLPFVLGSRHAK